MKFESQTAIYCLFESYLATDKKTLVNHNVIYSKMTQLIYSVFLLIFQIEIFNPTYPFPLQI